MKRLLAWIIALVLLSVAAALIFRPHAAPPKARWLTLATFRGSATGKTPLFVTTGRWRVVWSWNPGQQPSANFGILVLRAGSEIPYDSIANETKAATGVSPEKGAGMFYLDVQTASPYTARVETYAPERPTQPSYRWRTVYETSGQQDHLSPLLHMKKPWRVVWSSGPGAGGTFAISVMQPGQDLPFDFIANISGTANAIAYEYGGGSYSLNIASTEPYQISVEQGYAK